MTIYFLKSGPFQELKRRYVTALCLLKRRCLRRELRCPISW